MKDTVHFTDILRYPVAALTCIGCFHVLRYKEETWLNIQTNKLKKTFVQLFAVLVATVQFLSFVRSVGFLVYVAPNFDNLKSFYIQCYLSVMYGSLMYFFESVMCHKYFGSVIKELEEYGKSHGFCKNLLCIKKRALLSTIILFLSIVADIVVYVYLTSIEDNSVNIFPFSHKSIFLSCFLAFIQIINILPIPFFLILYTLTIEIVMTEFRDTSSKLLHILRNSTQHEAMEQGFFSLRSRHQHLCKVVDCLSELTRLAGTISLLFSVVILFFILFALGSGQMSTNYIIIEMTFLVWTMVPVLEVCIIWGRLPDAAHSITNSISRVSFTGISNEFLLQMQLFVTCCSSKKVGIDMFGFFTLDSQTFLMVMGTIVTYGIVVIQFQHDNGKSVTCQQNGTLL